MTFVVSVSQAKLRQATSAPAERPAASPLTPATNHIASDTMNLHPSIRSVRRRVPSPPAERFALIMLVAFWSAWASAATVDRFFPPSLAAEARLPGAVKPAAWQNASPQF